MTKREYKELLERYKTKTSLINTSSIESIKKETPEEQERRIAKLLMPENYGLFFDYYFGKNSDLPLADCPSAWFHIDIYKDLYYNNFITLFNMLHRGAAKSTHGNLGYPFALKQAGKSKFFLTVGANEVRAAMLLQDLQVQFECNNRIIKDFGVQKSIGSWADGQFETTDRCTFMSLGIDQPFRGLRANGVRLEYVSIDDIEDDKKSLNTTLIDEYSRKITGDIQGAFSTTSERTIINNNYFVEKGLIGTLLKKKGFQMRNVNTKKNNVISVPHAKLYQINLTTKYFDSINPTADDWQPSWPERFSREYCIRKIEQYQCDKATLSNEFYNTPIKVGKLFKPEDIKWVKPSKLDSYDLIVDFWDFSYTANGDTKAKARVGCKNNQLTLLDIFCANCDIDTALSSHFFEADKLTMINPSYVAFYDGNVAQQAIYTPVLHEAAVLHRSCNIPIPTHNATDKYTKISTILGAAINNGTLLFSEKLKNSPYWEEASFQLFAFEKGSKAHDDFPDALAEAVAQAKKLYSTTAEFNFKPIISKRKRGNY